MLRRKIWRLNRFFLEKNIISQLAWLTLASYGLLLLSLPVQALISNAEHVTEKGPGLKDLLLVIVVAPVLETLINQFGVFLLFKKVFNWGANKNGYIILISAIFFGLLHSYSMRYQFSAFVTGIVLGYAYYLYHKQPGKAIFRVALLHAVHNGIACATLLLFPTLK